MAGVASSSPAAAGGGGSSSSSSAAAAAPPPAEVEAVAADWMLEFACYCLCRHFGEGRAAPFRRWRAVAQALINGLSKIPTHQKKTVYLCQLLIRIAEGKNLECHFENDERMSPLESALSFWTLLEREEIKLEKLHGDIRRLIQIQIVAVHMENGYFKEAAEVLERLFTDSESDKPLRVKLASIIKSKDPYVPLLQTFSYDLLTSKIKSYIEPFMERTETNFLIQAATKHVESKGLGATALQNKTVNENDKRNLETNQRSMEEQQSITDQSPGGIKKPTVRPHPGRKPRVSSVLQSLNNLQNVEKHGDALACGRRRQRWTYKEDLELKSGIREFGVGNWAKILVHGDFNNRTSVMLKDRWRTLCRIEQG
ncbi:telomeric repeat-binding factor 1 isoform X2 [Aquila chrysaetos chrysaetos]|uniref:telomeric repeat-binding factor 1 isoform X2 n=1 Tax=Aquila chrysaetos chrysaetos TaxID=223781 RepID=UPI0011771B6F|nr:telomeric repeat-binding factor 1 isoform X2 [Aquila chrysaetos chrysaetos]